MQERNIEPEKFGDRIIIMTMFNDIEWTRKGNREICISNSEKSQDVREEILAGTLDVPRPWRRKEGNYKPEGKWNSIASQMVQRYKETGHPVFTSASALSRGILRKLKGKETIHFNSDASNRTLIPNHSLSKSAQQQFQTGVKSSI